MIFSTGYEMVREVANQGSFSKAANSLGVSGPAVSKQVKSLEERLGLVLFHRTTRAVSLTQAGRQLVDVLNRGDDEISSLLDKLSEGQETPSGKLKINAPMAFGERFLIGQIAEYARLYPNVIVDVEFNDKRVHLVEEGFDLVIRIGALEDSGLIAKRLCNFPSRICASPDFVKKFGTPNRPSDLRQIPAIQYTNATTGPSLSFKSQDGIEEAVHLTPAMYANSIEMLLESTLKGIGFVRAPAFAVNEHLKEGRLIHLLPKYQSIPERCVYAMYPDKRFLPLKVRKFIDILSDYLGNMDQDFEATVDHFTPVAGTEIKQ